jgi:hypothetical protein
MEVFAPVSFTVFLALNAQLIAQTLARLTYYGRPAFEVDISKIDNPICQGRECGT